MNANANAGGLIRRFYAARRSGDLAAVAEMLARDVVWREPSVENYMGELIGADAVIDMMQRALATTGGTFRLEVAELIEVAGHCAAVIAWSADKGDTRIEGRELATFSVRDGRITFAQFLPENISDDRLFWS